MLMCHIKLKITLQSLAVNVMKHEYYEGYEKNP